MDDTDSLESRQGLPTALEIVNLLTLAAFLAGSLAAVLQSV